MSGNPLYDYISSAAVSMTMAGNTGISPFLTLFLLGLIELIKPELLNMDPKLENILASGWSIVIFAALAIAELVAKCIPALDEIIDSAEVFVIPLISILSTMATMGLLPGADGGGPQEDAGQGVNIDAIGMFYRDEDYRYLQEDIDENGFSEGFMNFTKFSLVIIGMGLALAMHILKMIIRVSSLVCSGGCCQPCITIMEYMTVVVGVVLAIMLPAFAIVACIVMVGISLYVIGLKCRKKKEENESETKNKTETNNGGKMELEWKKDDQNDVERPRTQPQSTAPHRDPANEQLEQAIVVGIEEEVPFDVPLSPPGSPIPKYDVPLSLPDAPIPKYDAKTY